MAPINSKTGSAPAGAASGKSGLYGGKKDSSCGKSSHSDGKSGHSDSKKGKSSGFDLFKEKSSKTTANVSYSSTPTRSKPSSSFGVIWIPGRKHNRQKKDKIYNAHHNDYSKKREYPHNHLIYLCSGYCSKEREGTVPNIKQNQAEQPPYSWKSSESFSMSGDSPDTQAFKPKEEVSERHQPVVAAPPAPVPAVITAVASTPLTDVTRSDDTNTDENTNHVFHKYDDDHDKEGAGDAKNKEDDYLENRDDDDDPKGLLDSKTKSKKDDMDGVYVKRQQPHKTRSVASSADDDDCGRNCLYYTMQCCDCSLM